FRRDVTGGYAPPAATRFGRQPSLTARSTGDQAPHGCDATADQATRRDQLVTGHLVARPTSRRPGASRRDEPARHLTARTANRLPHPHGADALCARRLSRAMPCRLPLGRASPRVAARRWGAGRADGLPLTYGAPGAGGPAVRELHVGRRDAASRDAKAGDGRVLGDGWRRDSGRGVSWWADRGDAGGGGAGGACWGSGAGAAGVGRGGDGAA